MNRAFVKLGEKGEKGDRIIFFSLNYYYAEIAEKGGRKLQFCVCLPVNHRSTKGTMLDRHIIQNYLLPSDLQQRPKLIVKV